MKTSSNIKVKKIVVLPGDGIGPEVVAEAVKVLSVIAENSDLKFSFEEGIAGGVALEQQGIPLPEETLKLCQQSDAVLLGAVGDPRWDNNPSHLRPEVALLGLREKLGLFANLRPAKLYPSLIDASTLKKEVIEGIDLLVVRELTGGIYFSQPKGIKKTPNGECGFNTLSYNTFEIERIAKVAFQLALKRRRKVTSVDKANVLESSQLWRKVVTQVAKEYPTVELNHLYVDNCAMQLVRNPKQFDVILTGNLFGDILSDEAAMLTGSIGMLPSASLGEKHAMYEPVHGSAPDIAGLGIANPLATIASVAMMLRYSFEQVKQAEAIENSIASVLEQGYRTKDIMQEGCQLVSTQTMGNLVAEQVKQHLNT